MSETPNYLWVVCQAGAERALKGEFAAEWPEFRLSYSRPGFVTFKLPDGCLLDESVDLRSTFARAYAFSLGRVLGNQAEAMAADFWGVLGSRPFAHVHVWQRDTDLPGHRGYEPGLTPLVTEIAEMIVRKRPGGAETAEKLAVNRLAKSGQTVVDCVIVEPGEWWLGWHRAAAMPSRFPGGVCLTRRRPDVISRAYWKTREALNWSQLPVETGDRCVEIGSAPGGSSQALLDMGLRVTGIDPADMDEELLRHPAFTHVRKRASELKRREFRSVRWLLADSNVAPNHTLDSVEAIVTHPDVHVRGMLLTLKLLDWELAALIPTFLARIRSWGFHYVRARQLAFSRQEICVAAMRERSMRREASRKAQRRRPAPSADDRLGNQTQEQALVNESEDAVRDGRGRGWR